MNDWQGRGSRLARAERSKENTATRRERLSLGGPGYPGKSRAEETRRNTARTVEIVLAMAGHQPFGLLMSQIYNILRSQGERILVRRYPDAEQGRLWAEIEYEGRSLRVLELTRVLTMSLVETIDRSKILLTGKLLPNGAIDNPFGVAVDDILAVRNVRLDDLRLLPAWLCSKRLGKLIWGVALLDLEETIQQNALNSLQPANLLAPVQLADFMTEAVNFENGYTLEKLAFREALPGPGPQMSTALSQSAVKTKNQPEAKRPVMLLNLEVLKDIVYK